MPSLRLEDKKKMGFVPASQLVGWGQENTSGTITFRAPHVDYGVFERPNYTNIQSELQRWYREFLCESTPRAERDVVLLIEKDLGWTREEAAEVRARLSSFSSGWEAPGMEDYDEL